MGQEQASGSIIQFQLDYQEGQLTDVSTTSPPLNHFFKLLKLSRAYHTWVNYAHDLKQFFAVVAKEPDQVTRGDCLTFIQDQVQAGYTQTTINRRLAAVSSLYNELRLLDPERFAVNPVQPQRRGHRRSPVNQSLYRQQPQRLPEVIADADLQRFFALLPSWRDRTLVLLMWVSCLRVSEAVSICFADLECSRRRLRIQAGKGGQARTVYLDEVTFAALNRYLDEERGQLFPEEAHLFVAFKGKRKGQALRVNAVQKMVKYYGQQCELPHLHAHLFRHTGITQLVEQGMPEPALRQFVGHRRPESLLPYLHLSDTYVESEFAQAQAGLNLVTWFDEPGQDEGRAP